MHLIFNENLVLIFFFTANLKIEKRGNVKHSLIYIPTVEKTDKSLVHITDIQEYKNKLYSYPVNHITL